MGSGFPEFSAICRSDESTGCFEHFKAHEEAHIKHWEICCDLLFPNLPLVQAMKFSFLFYCKWTFCLDIPSTTIKTITENLPENIASCIPFYDLIQQHVKSKTGWIQEPKTPLSPIGAYAYPDYSVVTMESGGWFGWVA